jgi:hypothetical protein
VGQQGRIAFRHNLGERGDRAMEREPADGGAGGGEAGPDRGDIRGDLPADDDQG